jgi:hypothetical protein
MAQFKIKQVRGLQSTIDSITGIDTITEAYTTTATDGPTGITITYSCRETDNAQVYVNGVRLNQGDFGWREGTTDVSANTELNSGTELVWNSSAIGFDLSNDDEVEIIYETGIPVSTGGSVGTGTNGTSGTSGISGTSGTSGVNGTSGTSGTSGITNSNATGLTLTSPSGILYQVVVDDSGNLSTSNVGTSGTSGGSSSPSGGFTTTGLVANLDSSDPSSYSGAYPGSGLWPWYDLTGNGHTAYLHPTLGYNTNEADGVFEWQIEGTINDDIFWGEASTISKFSPWVSPNQTIQLWVYIPDNSPIVLFKKQNLGGSGWALTINNNGTNDQYSVGANGYGMGPYAPSGTGTNMDGWNLITMQWKDDVTATFNGTDYVGWRLFVNDNPVEHTGYADHFLPANPITSWSGWTQETESLIIGITNGATGTYEWTGKVGAFSFYDRVLSEQEIIDNYNATKSRFGL